MEEEKRKEWMQELLNILQEQEVALFSISSEDVGAEKAVPLNQAKVNNKRAQDKLKEMLLENGKETVLSEEKDKEIEKGVQKNGAFLHVSISVPSSPNLQSSPSSPSLHANSPTPRYLYRSAPTSPSMGSISLSFDSTMAEKERDYKEREKEKKTKSLANFFFSRSKSSLSLPQYEPEKDKEEKEKEKEKEKDKEKDNNGSTAKTLSRTLSKSPLGRHRLSLTSSTDTLRRKAKEKEKEKEKMKNKEEIDNYFQMYENSKMLFEKKRELLKTSSDMKIIKEEDKVQ